MKSGFTRDKSLMLKGVGILLMMWHHCFYKGRFENYYVVFSPLTIGQATRIAGFCKICVTMFVFVSGYGLYQIYKNKSQIVGAGRWIIHRYLKGFLPFWFIYLLSFVSCALIDGRTWTVYFKDHIVNGFVYVFLDFLGLAKLFGSPSLSGTWWYMSAYFQYIVLFPLLFCIIEKYGSLFLVAIVLIFPRIAKFEPGGKHMYSFLLSIVLGMVFKKELIFEKIDAFTEKRNNKILIVTGLTLLSAFLYKASVLLPNKLFYDVIWDIFPMVFIVLFYLVIPYLHLTQKFLKLIGIHSANIFMLHTFLLYNYLSDFIYGREHFILIMLTLLALSLMLSYCVEGLKKLVRFPVLVKKIDAYFAIN